jgi:myo-inositol-1(or 4)-monophosphatase
LGKPLVLVRNGKPVLSIVYDPSMGEVFVAATGEGATCNGQAVKASPKSNLSAAVVGTAVPPLGQAGEAEQDDALALIRTVACAVFVVRPMAAASLQLAYVAAGRLDAYFENGLDAADWLAGALLIQEAGGVVTDLAGNQFGWSGDGILSAGAVLHPAMAAAIDRTRRSEQGA